MTWKLRKGWLAVALVAVLVASQALAAQVAPPEPTADTGRLLRRTGFAYMGGLRTFAAAVLWNRLDPVFHAYYGKTSLAKQRYIMPTVYVVQMLDPQLEQPYYLGSYVLARNGDFKRATTLAMQGVAHNPKSGLLRANYVQILFIQDPVKNLDLMVKEADAGLDDEVYWTSPEDHYEGLAMFRSVYRRAGDTSTASAIRATMDRLGREMDVGDHDHDGDGAQDH